MDVTPSPAHDAIALPQRQRFRRHECRIKNVRRIGNKYQARVWHKSWAGTLINRSVNLGLFDNENLAWEAVKVWTAAGCHPARGFLKDVLPWFVRYGSDGLLRADGWYCGERVYRSLPFPTAEEAFGWAWTRVVGIRERHGPLPRGVFCRAKGYAARVWTGNRDRTLPFTYPTPTAAAAAIAHHDRSRAIEAAA